jgi:ATP-dependent RNA helicase DDX19/DBP5
MFLENNRSFPGLPYVAKHFFFFLFLFRFSHFAGLWVFNSYTYILFSFSSLLQVLDVIKQLWVDTRTYQSDNLTGSKLEFLADIYSLLTIGQSIVFVGRKTEADAVHATLSAAGYTCSVLHGAVEPAQRDATMEAFRNGQSNVLITTNVLARGVDVDNVCLVVNYDIPVDRDGRPDHETYIHRIGRTGRFGRKGTAINLIVDEKSIEVLAEIERYFAKDGKEMIQRVEADPEALADVIEI